MYNYIFLIGKVKAMSKDTITLEVKEPFKNTHGEVDSHEFKIHLTEFVMETLPVNIYNKTIAIKGRVTKENNHLKLIGERINYMEEQYGK